MLHTRAHYQNQTRSEVEAAVRREGFSPLLIADPPGAAYPPHKHPETKVLAFLRGTMEVMIDGHRFECSAGDRVIIPGDLFHAAIVGPEGCDFFWSEKLIRNG